MGATAAGSTGLLSRRWLPLRLVRLALALACLVQASGWVPAEQASLPGASWPPSSLRISLVDLQRPPGSSPPPFTRDAASHPRGGEGSLSLRLRGGARIGRDLFKASSLTGFDLGHAQAVYEGKVTKGRRRKWWRYTIKPVAPKVEPKLHNVDWTGALEPRDWTATLIIGPSSSEANSTALIQYNEIDLLRCANDDDSRGIRSLVKKKGVSVDTRDPDCRGATALHFAAGKGYIGPVKRLIKYGANPNARTDDGHTPMHWAASMGHTAIVQRLVRAGASLTAKTDGADITPLMTATANGHQKLAELIEDILEEREKKGKKQAKRQRQAMRKQIKQS